jgi:transposase
VGRQWSCPGQRRDDGPGLGTAGFAAQKKTLIATEQDPLARAVWREAYAAIPATSLVFLDETSTQVTMTRTRGRATRGQRVVDRVPRNHGQNVTCLTAISPHGIHAPCVFEDALDGPLFLQWVRDWLLPGLSRGTTLVLDNLNVHRNPAVRQVVEAAGCFLLFLPAYSPDFNPIELVFAQLKTHLRGVAARTTEAVIEAIGHGMDRITPRHIQACYRHCGYPLPDRATQPS